MTRRRVDLPQPFGPMRATMPPPGMSRSIPAEDRQRGVVAALEGERQVAQLDGAGTHAGRAGPGGVRRDAVAGHAAPSPSGRRIGAVAGYRADVRGVGPVVERGQVAARLDPARDPGHRADGGREVGVGADPDGAQDGRAEDRGLEHRRHGHVEPRHVGLDRVPERAPGRAAADAHLGDGHAGGEHRRGDVADRQRGRLDDRAGDVAAAVREGQTGEHAARLRVPDRRPLAGEVRQEDEAVGAGWRRGRLGQERLGRDRAAEDVRRGTSRAPGRSPPSRPRRCTARRAAPASRTRPGPRRAGPSRRRTRRPTRPGRRRRPARADRPRGSSRRRRPSRRRRGCPAGARGHRRRCRSGRRPWRRSRSAAAGGRRRSPSPRRRSSAGTV